MEVVEGAEDGPYRGVYTVRLAQWIYVFPCIQKKSTKGIEAPKTDMDLVKARLKAADADQADSIKQAKGVRK